MKILFLSDPKAYYLKQIPNFLSDYGDKVNVITRAIDITDIKELNPDYILCDRYNYILKADVLEAMGGRAINLHPSYLPWNKGCRPNFFSIYDQTITGVSIHQMNKGIDTGDIIVQRKVDYEDEDTLKTSFYKSRTSIINMLFENWLDIKNQNIRTFSQIEKGSYNSEKKFQQIWPKLIKGWNTTISEVKDLKKSLLNN